MKPKMLPKRIEGVHHQGAAPIQEDCFEYNSERGIFVLSDGFGGSHGREASLTAVRSIRNYLEQEAGDLDATLPFEIRPYFSLAGNVLFNAISFANQSVYKQNESHSALNSGGASVLAATLDGNLLSLASVGACRAFLKRNNQVKELVQPRSLGRQKDPFSVSNELSTVPMMSLGTAKRLEPELTEVEVRVGDELLWLSTGVPEAWKNQWEKLSETDVTLWLEQILAVPARELKYNASLVWVAF